VAPTITCSLGPVIGNSLILVIELLLPWSYAVVPGRPAALASRVISPPAPRPTPRRGQQP
jgi:hypothetical protein